MDLFLIILNRQRDFWKAKLEMINNTATNSCCDTYVLANDDIYCDRYPIQGYSNKYNTYQNTAKKFKNEANCSR